jgi:hypothetical protein
MNGQDVERVFWFEPSRCRVTHSLARDIRAVAEP